MRKSIEQLHKEAKLDADRVEAGREIKKFYCHNCREEKSWSDIESKPTRGEWNANGNRHRYFCTECKNTVTTIT